jgi:large subunit ribosomal protein L7/L12
MAFDKDAFLTALDSMTVMELNDLVKAIEEKFGVSAAAMAAPPPVVALCCCCR